MSSYFIHISMEISLQDRAHSFLHMIVARKIDEAYDLYVAHDFIHHNQYFRGDRESLKQGMIESHTKSPHTELTILKTLEEADTVATYSKVKMHEDDLGMIVVHIMRFKENKIIEMWDVGQQLLPGSPNENGIA